VIAFDSKIYRASAQVESSGNTIETLVNADKVITSILIADNSAIYLVLDSSDIVGQLGHSSCDLLDLL